MDKMPDGFQDLDAYLYSRLKEMIRTKSLAPGAKIKQEEIAERLGVSRTPIIRVLERLTSENVVEHVPRRGFYVKRLTLSEMLDIFYAREVVEGIVARLVAEKATDSELEEIRSFFSHYEGLWDDSSKLRYRRDDQAFHARMAEIADSGLVLRINEMFNVYMFSYQKGLMRPPEETLEEHLEIIKAIGSRDAREAQRLAMLHIEKSRRNIARVYSETTQSGGETVW